MQKRIVRKSGVVGIIVLFIGASSVTTTIGNSHFPVKLDKNSTPEYKNLIDIEIDVDTGKNKYINDEGMEEKQIVNRGKRFDDWDCQIVEYGFLGGRYSSLALDNNDHPHISYLDEGNIALKYASWTGSRWSNETVDSNGGQYTSLALDNNDYPHISYHDLYTHDLKYAYWTGSRWSIEIVDSFETVDITGQIEWYTSLALDNNDHPHISYYHISYYDEVPNGDIPDGDLRYAYWTGTNWSIETVDSIGDVGFYSSLALDNNNHPHISYYDDHPNGDLRYAYWTGTNWSIETVDSDGYVGDYTSLSLDNNDYPHISYHDLDNHDLKYAYWTGTTWSIETVDSTGGSYTSLALDNNDHPHISYYTGTLTGTLRYAVWTGSYWRIETVDSNYFLGYTSLALDSDVHPHISYCAGGSLKFAEKTAIVIYVDDDNTQGPWYGTLEHPYQYIQDGVDAANPGEVIFVFSGLYNESVRILQSDNKSSIAIVGEDKNTTIIDAENAKKGILAPRPPLLIHSNNISISGFTLQNPHDSYIVLEIRGNKNYISNNIFKNFEMWAFLEGVSMFGENNTIINNFFDFCWLQVTGETLSQWNTHTIENNNINELPILYFKDINGGIVPGYASQLILANCSNITIAETTYSYMLLQLGFCSYIEIANNIFTSSMITIDYSQNIIIADNLFDRTIVYSSSQYDFVPYGNKNNQIFNNEFNNSYGFAIIGENTVIFYNEFINTASTLYVINSTIERNKFTDIPIHALYISAADCSIKGNEFNGSHYPGISRGLMFLGGYNNTISDNNFSDLDYGLWLDAGFNNTISDNNFSDLDYGIFCSFGSHSNFVYHNNFIDNTQHATEYGDDIWDDGYPSGGNYWDDYQGVDNYSGPYQNITGGDGIGDTPYNISGDSNRDRYPLMNPWAGESYPPTAKSGGPYYSNPGYAVRFDGSNSYDNDEDGQEITRYDWKFFHNDTWHNSTGSKPNYTYQTIGNYTVTLRVWDDEGDNDTDTDAVIIDYQPHPPTADADGPYYAMEDDDPVMFNATGSHDNDENGSAIVQYDWKWTHDDTWHTNLGPLPSYIYTQEGTYTASVRVHDDEGYTDADTTLVSIEGYKPPTANPNGPYHSMEDDPIQFDAANSHDNDENGQSIVQYDWQWTTDGPWENNLGATPSQTYYDEGVYYVTLRVHDDEGETSTKTTYAIIEGYYPPTAVTGGPYHGIIDEPMIFDGSSSHDNDENMCCINQYDWDFGDGSGWHNNISSTPSHIYNVETTYTLSLRVHDDEGEEDIATTTVTITSYQDPIADAGGPYTGDAYSPITFDASGSYDGDENGCCITGYQWDWTNDGQWDTGWLANPVTTHTYTSGFTGSVKLQVKDDDPGGATDTDTALVTIQSPPPTADFTIQRTNNPSIFIFDGSTSIDPRPGHDYHDLIFRWDFDNDGAYDDATGYLVTWSFSTSGEKTISLKVENPDGFDTCTDTVTAFHYNDINVRCSNPNFFLSYPGASIPPLKNRYYFTTPSGVFTKVTFQIGSHLVTDTSGNLWEGVLHMSKGNPGDFVRIKGYSGSRVVWTKTLPAHIIITPSWFVTFIGNAFPSVNHYNNYGRWIMDVHPASCGLEFGMPHVPGEYVGGDYNFDASISTPDWFRIDSSESLAITQTLVSGSYGAGMELGSHSIFGFDAGAGFSADVNVEINSHEVVLVGWISIQGSAGISYSMPIFVIPFLADAGLTGGFDGFVGIGFEIVRFGHDGFTFCPGRNAEVYVGVGVHFGVYGQVLFGLGRLEGGLYCDGTLTMKIPSLRKFFNLQGGGYVTVSALWGAISKTWKFPVVDISMSLDKGFRNMIGNESSVQYWESRTLDLLCLKDFDRGRAQRDAQGTTMVAENAGELAVPKVMITEHGEGICVWSDIAPVENGSAFQSDIYWSTYDGTRWSNVQTTNTSGRCEYDPELVILKDNSVEQVVLTYLVVDHVIDNETDPDVFYAGSRIHTALWNKDHGWSFEGENLLVYGGTVNARSMSADDNGNVLLLYLVDTDCDPWENGVGKLYMVNGTVFDDEVLWESSILVRSFTEVPEAFSPKISFVNESVGGIVYSCWNESTQLNDTILVPTVAGVDGFSDAEIIVHSTNRSVGYVSSVVINDSIMVFWVENHSRICRCIVDTDSLLNNWVVGDRDILLANTSIVSLKPECFDEKRYLLFQSGEDFTPYVLEELPGGVWGNLRQISVERSYSLGQVDGDSNSRESHLVYLVDTPLEEWLVGRWRFNEGNETNVSDSSGLGNDGVLRGNPVWIDHMNDTLDPVYGFGLSFNGSEDYVEIPSSTSLRVQDEFTSTCWLCMNSSSSGSTILGVDGSWQILEVNGTLKIKMWREDDEVLEQRVANLTIGTWTFIGVVYNHGVLNVVVLPKGLENTSKIFEFNDSSIVWSETPMILGGFYGCIDEVWIFNQDISMSEVESIWFTPYTKLSSIHDVVVQHMPSFASFSFGTRGKREENITTEDAVVFEGSPSNFTFEWEFGDGTTAQGTNVSHQYDTAGYYTIVCNATDPSTNAVTPVSQSIKVGDATPPLFDGVESALPGDNSAQISWNEAVDTGPFVVYYGFMRNTSESFNFSNPCFVTKDTSNIVENLVANETYYFIVRAVDAAGNMDSNMAEISTTPCDSSPPVFSGLTGLYVISNQEDSVLLEWAEGKDSSEPIMYNVYMSNMAGGQDFSSPNDSTNCTWLLMNRLDLVNMSYYFVVRAEDSWGNEDNNTVELGINLPDFVLPEIIDYTETVGYTGEEFSFVATIFDNVAVSSTWVEYWYDDDVHTNVSMINVGGDTWENTIIVDDTLDDLHYVLSANDTSNNWNTTEVKTVTISDNDNPEISEVHALPSVQSSGGYVNLSATVLDNIQVDEVYVHLEHPNGNSTTLSLSIGIVENFSITQNQTGDTYYCNRTYDQRGPYTFHVWANDTSGNTNCSSEYTFAIVNTPPSTPSQPLGPTSGDICIEYSYSTATIDYDGDEVRYGWDWNGDLAVDDWSEWYSSGETCTMAHGWTDPGMYSVRVKAKDSYDAASNWSDPLVVTMENHPPVTPNSPSPDDGATGVDIEADLSWTGGDPDVCDTVTYDVYFGLSIPPLLVASNQSATTYDPGMLEYCTLYYWKIVAWDNHGASTESPVWSFKTNCRPDEPCDPHPEDDAVDVAIDADLNWSCSDPDGDPLTYNVYFEAENPDPEDLLSENQTATTYDPGTLEYETTYYWQIIAWDNHSASTIGPVWSFTTEPEPVPDVFCTGDLSWVDVKPGSTVTGELEVSNVGDPESLLTWEVTSWPSWGAWTFTPSSGTNLTPQASPIIVQVEVVAPDEQNSQFSGEVKLVNVEDPENDFCIISVSLVTPESQQSHQTHTYLHTLFRQNPVFNQLFLYHLLNLYLTIIVDV
jgi:PKD repeat protein